IAEEALFNPVSRRWEDGIRKLVDDRPTAAARLVGLGGGATTGQRMQEHAQRLFDHRIERIQASAPDVKEAGSASVRALRKAIDELASKAWLFSLNSKGLVELRKL